MNEHEDIRSLKIALGGYFLVFVMKLVVYFVTGVMALKAEAFHTLSDIFVSGFLLIAIYYSRKPADQVHMFGYGRAQNIAALVAATLFISFTSYKLLEESIPRLFTTGETEYKNLWLAIGVIVLSMVIAAIPLFRLVKNKQRGAAAKAQFMGSINDELGLVAALFGTIAVFLGIPIADPIATILVAAIIAYNGIKLFLENFSLLLGKSPGVEYSAKIETVARSVPGVLGVHDVRVEYVGPDTLHAGLHIEVASDMTIMEADRLAKEVEQKIHSNSEIGYCYVQAEPFMSERKV